MKSLVTFFTIILLVVFFAACQKELQFDVIPDTGEAKGTLKSASGGCLPSSINGSYFKDTALNATNFIEVTLDITKAGWYKITTDTVAGMYFIDSGSVNEIRLHTIQLKGKGIPTSTGQKIFTVKFGTSSCKISVLVQTGVITNPNATFIFGGGPSTCTGFILSGNPYTVGTPTNALQTVMLNVMVTTAGLYSVTTGAAINGLVFTATGSFNFSGPNTVFLTASGTPIANGNFNYTITNSTSSCVFTIGVTTTPPVGNLDYLPMTTNSNWTNRIITTPPPTPDTSFIQVSPSQKTFGANSYHIFERKQVGVVQDSSFFRKNGGLYYQYINGKIGNTTVPVNQEYLVLDSNRAINIPWATNFGTITIMGIPLGNFTVTGRITEKGATEIIEGIAYNNVLKVSYVYAGIVFGTPTVVATEDRWFAKGKGIIKSVIEIPLQSINIETRLTRSQIF